jgi:hypothetical protein
MQPLTPRHEVIALDCELWRDQAISDARYIKRHISHDPAWRDIPYNRERLRLAVEAARTWNRHALDYHRQSRRNAP